ncbi:MAG: peptidylprolyl isomerase [bacterium]
MRIPVLGKVSSIILAAIAGGVLVLGGQLVLRHFRPGLAADVLVSVGGKPITVQAFHTEVAARGGAAAFATGEERRALLDEMIRVAVLANNAEQEGYLQRTDVRREINRVLADRYQRQHIDEPLAGLSVEKNDVADYYRVHLESFAVPESVHVAIIALALPDGATEVAHDALRGRAQALRERAAVNSNGDTFASLAAQQSDDAETRAHGGDAGWLAAGDDTTRWEPAVRAAALALATPGEVSPSVATPSGVYIVKLLERSSASIRPLAEVAKSIEQQLVRDERQHRAAKLYAAALAKAGMQVNEGAIEALEAAEKAASDAHPGSAAPAKG